MSDELEQLRADLEVLERHQANGCARVVKEKIAALEAAAADPWREAKEFCDDYRGDKERFGIVTAYIDHLTAENARLTKRVAELEKASEIVRRLATYINERQLFVLIEDAQSLWESMKGAGDE